MSAFFLPATASFIAAVSVGVSQGRVLFSNLLALFVLPLAAFFLYRRGGRAAGLLTVAGSAALGLLLGWADARISLGPGHVALFAANEAAYVEGRIREVYRYPRKVRLEIECLRAGLGGGTRKVHGRLLLTIARPARSFAPGCVIAFRTRLRRPENFGNPGEFNYEGFLARRGIYVTGFLWDDSAVKMTPCPAGRYLLERWRSRVRRLINQAARAEAAPVLLAMVLGERRGVPNRVGEDLSRAGVSHVLAISGLHIGLVYGCAYFAAWRLLATSSRLLLTANTPAIVGCIALIPALVYASLAGWSVSTQRALLMVVAFAGAAFMHRRIVLVRSLALAALVLVAASPTVVLEPSFQLSFAAVLGIAAVLSASALPGSRRATRGLPASAGLLNRAAAWIRGPLYISMAAAISTAPIVAWHFQRVSLVGPLANLVLLPILGPGAVVPAVLGAFLLPASETLARACFIIASLAVDLGLHVAGFLAHLPGASWSSFLPTDVELFLYYLVLVLVVWSRHLGRRYLLLVLAAVVVGVAADGGFWLWRRYLDPRLHVTFLSVGQGEAAVVEFPGGKVMVIDSGPHYASGFDAGERLVAPFLRSRKILALDYLVITHQQADHCGGAPFLAHAFAPRAVWWNGGVKRRCLAAVGKALAGSGAAVRALHAGVKETIGGVEVTVCHPPAGAGFATSNNASLVLRLSYGGVSVALTGDIEAAAEGSIVDSGCLDNSQILKVPHHGSSTSSTPAFLQALVPQVAVFSVGRHNRFGFPRDEVVRRYQRRGARIFRTDLDGAVEVVSNGKSYAVLALTRSGLSPLPPPTSALPRHSSLWCRCRRARGIWWLVHGRCCHPSAC